MYRTKKWSQLWESNPQNKFKIGDITYNSTYAIFVSRF